MFYVSKGNGGLGARNLFRRSQKRKARRKRKSTWADMQYPSSPGLSFQVVLICCLLTIDEPVSKLNDKFEVFFLDCGRLLFLSSQEPTTLKPLRKSSSSSSSHKVAKQSGYGFTCFLGCAPDSLVKVSREPDSLVSGSSSDSSELRKKRKREMKQKQMEAETTSCKYMFGYVWWNNHFHPFPM